jgi:type IV pilus assembly protein PilM
VAQQRTIKRMLSFIFSSSAWCAAFALDGDGVLWAVIQESSKGPLLLGYGFDTSGEEALSHVRGIAADTIYLASVLPSLPTLCRQISLPRLQPKEVEIALIDTLEQTVAIGVGESLVAYESHPSDDGAMTVTAYLAKQTAIQEHLSSLKSLSIDPEWVIPKAACLAAFISHFALNGWHYVIDISADETTTVLIFNGHVIESRSLVGGSFAFTSLEHPSEKNDEHLRLILQHLTEAVLAYKERYGLDGSIPLTITGRVLSVTHAATVIAEFVQTPLSQLHAIDDNSLLQCAAALGAAFLSQPKNSHTSLPNFRIGEFAFARPMLHWKRPLIALGVGCLAAASIIAWYGASRSQMIAEEMRNDWKKITAIAHTTPDEVTKQTERLLGSMYALQETPPEHLLAMGNWLLSSVERQTAYPLQPDVPRITDTIAWLSMQINDVAQSMHLSNEKFEIQTLQYQLIKHPTKNHPKDRYQVRVDLEFISPSIALARAFHDRLVTNTSCIDNASEVKWTPGNGKYRVTFVLKDKTHYPQQEP